MNFIQDNQHFPSACPIPSPRAENEYSRGNHHQKVINLSSSTTSARVVTVTLWSESLGNTLQENIDFVSILRCFSGTWFWSRHWICSSIIMFASCVCMCMCDEKLHYFCGCKQLWEYMICLSFRVGCNCFF